MENVMQSLCERNVQLLSTNIKTLQKQLCIKKLSVSDNYNWCRFLQSYYVLHLLVLYPAATLWLQLVQHMINRLILT